MSKLATFTNDLGHRSIVLYTEAREVDPTFLEHRYLLEAKPFLRWEYFPYDAEPCFVWATENRASLQETLHDKTVEPATLSGILLSILSFIEALPDLPLSYTQILWNPEWVFIDAAEPFVRFIALPYRAELDKDSMTSDDLLEWLLAEWARSQDAEIPPQHIHPPFDLEEIREVLGSLTPSRQSSSPRRMTHLRSFLRLPRWSKAQKRWLFVLLHVLGLLEFLGIFTLTYLQLPERHFVNYLRQFPSYLSSFQRIALCLMLGVVGVLDLYLLLRLKAWRHRRKKPVAKPEEPAPQPEDNDPIEGATTMARLSIEPRSLKRVSQTQGLNEKGEAFIAEKDYYIGSDPTRTHLTLQAQGLSPLHVRICQRQGFFYLTDLSEHTGCKLEGRRIVRYEEYLLPDQAKLTLGPIRCQFERVM